MVAFRGSDQSLEEEIAALEAIASQRIRRYARELRELERDLKELKTERVRRRAHTKATVLVAESLGSAEVS
jgi:GAF domain-containing protein